MARLCEYRGRPFYRLSIPSPFRRNCFGLVACVLCVAARPVPRAVPASPTSRSPLRPIRYDKRGGCSETAGRPAARSTERRTGRAVSSRRECHASVAAAHPMRSSDRPPPCRFSYRRRSSVSFPHDTAARLLSSCPPFYIAPPNRHERRGAGRGGCLLGGDARWIKKAGGVSCSPSACFCSIEHICPDCSRS